MMAVGRAVELCRGLTDAEGGRHRRVRLAPMDGGAEQALAEGHIAGVLDVEDAFLADRIQRLGDYTEVGAKHVALLSRADRDRLVLEIRADLFGDRLMLSVTCANPVCAEDVDLELSVREIIGPCVEAPDIVSVETDKGKITVQPPLGHDVYVTGDVWPNLAIEAANSPAWSELDDADRQRVALALARVDGRPNLGVAAPCPACGLLIEIEIEPLDLLARELGLGVHRLTAEIHSIAFHYGWGEAEILALPRDRRWRYLELIADQVAGRSLNDGWR